MQVRNTEGMSNNWISISQFEIYDRTRCMHVDFEKKNDSKVDGSAGTGVIKIRRPIVCSRIESNQIEILLKKNNGSQYVLRKY